MSTTTLPTKSSFLAPIPALYHLGQALLASYASYLSYISIQRVRTYESATQKAAKYSNIAEHHLHQTQTTQGAGAVAVLASLSLSMGLFFGSRAPGPATVWCVVVAGGIKAAHSHISNYWRGKAKVPLPGSGDYNAAISSSAELRKALGFLAASWVLAAGWYGVQWIS